MMEDFVTYLKQIPLFQELAHEECMDIIRACAILPMKGGTVLCKEGDPGDAMFILETGAARVQKRTAQGLDEELATLGPRSVVGEMALLDGRPRSATVTLTESGSVYKLDLQGFALLRSNLRPAAFKVIRYLARVLCGHLRDLNTRIEDFYASPTESLQLMKRRQQQLQATVRERIASRPTMPVWTSPRGGSGSSLGPGKETHLSGMLVRAYAPEPGNQQSARVEFLSQVPMLKGLLPNELHIFDSVLSERAYADGQAICKEGDPGDSFFLVASGRVAVEKAVKGSAPQTLTTLPPGALIGEVSLIDGKRRSASCIARGPAVVFRCTQSDFDALFRSKSPFAFKFVDRLAMDVSKRVRDANTRFTDIFSHQAQTVEELSKRIIALHAEMEGGEADETDTSALLKLVQFRNVPSGG
jgi:CRP-like cAMP-binding protein